MTQAYVDDITGNIIPSSESTDSKFVWKTVTRTINQKSVIIKIILEADVFAGAQTTNLGDAGRTKVTREAKDIFANTTV